MKRNDFILIGIIILIAAGAFAYFQSTKEAGGKVIIKVDGKVYKELPLKEEASLLINGVKEGTNFLTIKDGQVSLTEATCPDKLCVKHKKIQYNGEIIVCLPNKVTIEIQSQTKSELDAVAN